MLYVSLHIPKTAGTSFVRALEHSFVPEELLIDYRHPRDYERIAARGVPAVETHRAWLDVGFGTNMMRYRQDRREMARNVRIVHGHFPVGKYHRALTWRTPFYIVWVRDPFARAVSNFFYWQTFDGATVPDPLVSKILLEGWSLEDFLFHPALRDYQCMFLRGLPWKRIDFLGVTEHYSEDLQRLAGLMNRPLGRFEENIGPKPDAVAQHAHLRARFMAFHPRDAQLYQYALDQRTAR